MTGRGSSSLCDEGNTQERHTRKIKGRVCGGQWRRDWGSSVVVIRGWRPVEHHVWGGEVECLGGKNVKEEGCGGKSLNQIGLGDTGLKQEGANNIIDGTNNAFNFTVLRRGIRTGHPELDVVGEEEGAGSMIVELASIIALNTLNGDTKLHSHIGKEIRQGRKSVRL